MMTLAMMTPMGPASSAVLTRRARTGCFFALLLSAACTGVIERERAFVEHSGGDGAVDAEVSDGGAGDRGLRDDADGAGDAGDRADGSALDGARADASRDAGPQDVPKYPPSTTFEWTQLLPSADTRRSYVSASGDDANDCASEAKPCRTIQRGLSRLRDGYPDWLLLKRGDVWYESITGPDTSWSMSGRSAGEPMVITAYGESGPRPLLKTGYNIGFWRFLDNDVHDVALVGIHFKAHTRDPYSSEYEGNGSNSVNAGFRWTGGGNVKNVLVEGCKFEFYGSNIVMHPGNGAPMFENVKIRGNVAYSAWYSGTYSQGLFVDRIRGLLIEGNLFDRNGGLIGYEGDPNGIVPSDVSEENVAVSWFDHQAYINSFNEDVVVANNIFTGGDGCQMRAGGLAANNLFVRAVNSLDVGVASSPTPGGVSGQVVYNVFLEGVDFPKNPSIPTYRANGIQVANISAEGGLQIEHNIFANDSSEEAYGRAVRLNGTNCGDNGESCAVRNVSFRQNVIYNWRGGFQTYGNTGSEVDDVRVEENFIQNPADDRAFLLHLEGGLGTDSFAFSGNTYFRGGGARWITVGQDEIDFATWVDRASESNAKSEAPNFPDASRTLGQYNALQGGEATHEDFMRRAREQSPYSWDPNLEAAAVNRWFREGFGMAEP